MKIIDLTAGNRAIWFNKSHPDTVFVDRRELNETTFTADSTDLPFGSNQFDLVVFDPPHLNCGKNSNMSKVYGHHTTAEIKFLLAGVGKEAHRISRSNALMALKWNTHDIKLQKVFDLMPQWEPLFGYLTKDGPRSQTYWCMLRRIGAKK